MAWKVECCECGEKQSFNDTKDISYAKWRVLAWLLHKNEPLVVCPDCEYNQPKKTKDKKDAVVHNSNLQPKDDGELTREVAKPRPEVSPEP